MGSSATMRRKLGATDVLAWGWGSCGVESSMPQRLERQQRRLCVEWAQGAKRTHEFGERKGRETEEGGCNERRAKWSRC